ncbi:SAM-dependent methyltransferase [Nonomuraea sp. NPDC049709]|uniref:SAM-dependent methyltransferase n=1 Tax=Nonomuraea sp. NPDC049709 TaxID=3154736 RepID=UPI0034209AF1
MSSGVSALSGHRVGNFSQTPLVRRRSLVEVIVKPGKRVGGNIADEEYDSAQASNTGHSAPVGGKRTTLDADLLGHRRPRDPINPNMPNVARMYDYFLGGNDNLAADRAAAEEALKLNPNARECARANRAFLGRAVRFLAERGVRQFLDIGSGLPAVGNVHQVAQAVMPDARTVYVDHDAVVLCHGRALLATDEHTIVVEADMRDPATILECAAERLDFSEPVAVLLVASLHFVLPEEDPYGIVRYLMGGTAPGSYLVVSHVLRTETTVRAVAAYARASAPVALRSEEEIAGFFEAVGAELVEPGLVRVPLWRPEMAVGLAALDAARVDFVGGVGWRP